MFFSHLWRSYHVKRRVCVFFFTVAIKAKVCVISNKWARVPVPFVWEVAEPSLNGKQRRRRADSSGTRSFNEVISKQINSSSARGKYTSSILSTHFAQPIALKSHLSHRTVSWCLYNEQNRQNQRKIKPKKRPTSWCKCTFGCTGDLYRWQLHTHSCACVLMFLCFDSQVGANASCPQWGKTKCLTGVWREAFSLMFHSKGAISWKYRKQDSLGLYNLYSWSSNLQQEPYCRAA